MQPSDTAELVEKVEDAQMALGSMASNRFGGPFREEVSAWLGKLGVISEQVRGPLLATFKDLESIHTNATSKKSSDGPAVCSPFSAAGPAQCPYIFASSIL